MKKINLQTKDVSILFGEQFGKSIFLLLLLGPFLREHIVEMPFRESVLSVCQKLSQLQDSAHRQVFVPQRGFVSPPS